MNTNNNYTTFTKKPETADIFFNSKKLLNYSRLNI